MENILHEHVEPGTEEGAGESTSNTTVCPKCGAIYTFKGENATGVCPKCGAKMEDAKDSIENADSGTGQYEVANKQNSSMNEDVNPFNTMKARWLNILKENKI
jgi:DNA-directed RNA polymerase subunit M/transcription elongation factor TFIIS